MSIDLLPKEPEEPKEHKLERMMDAYEDGTLSSLEIMELASLVEDNKILAKQLFTQDKDPAELTQEEGDK